MRRLLIVCLAVLLALPAAAPALAAEDGPRSGEYAALYRDRHYRLTGALYTEDGAQPFVRYVDGEDWDQTTDDGVHTMLLDHLLYTQHGRLWAVESPGIVRTVVYEDMTYSGSGESVIPFLEDPAEYAWESYSVEDCGCVTGRIETADIRFYFDEDGELYAIYSNMFGERSTVVPWSLTGDVPAAALKIPWWQPRLWEPYFY